MLLIRRTDVFNFSIKRAFSNQKPKIQNKTKIKSPIKVFFIICLVANLSRLKNEKWPAVQYAWKNGITKDPKIKLPQ